MLRDGRSKINSISRSLNTSSIWGVLGFQVDFTRQHVPLSTLRDGIRHAQNRAQRIRHDIRHDIRHSALVQLEHITLSSLRPPSFILGTKTAAFSASLSSHNLICSTNRLIDCDESPKSPSSSAAQIRDVLVRERRCSTLATASPHQRAIAPSTSLGTASSIASLWTS